MDIADLIASESVIVALPARDKGQLLRDLSQRAARALQADAPQIIGALQSREALGSTGVGQGIALPHARLAGLERFFGLFARLDRPIDFAAIDGRPVDLVFLLLIPEHAGGDHLTALALIARRLRDSTVAAQLRAATTPAELYPLLTGSPLRPGS